MDALKAQFERIRQQLAALSASQKMLVGALVAIMVMTIWYWGKFAGSAEMVPVLDQTLEDTDIGNIDHQLELAGVPHTVSSGKVLVPADRKAEILANLMFARALPQDTRSAFETMSKEINPFMPNTQVDMAYTEATALELSSLISHFPGVANARVIINAKNEQKIEGSIPPSATVFITTKGDADNAKMLVRAAADGVAHAVSGLTAGHISVIVNGNRMKVHDSDSDDAGVDDQFEQRQKREGELEQKIHNQFNYIPGLTVTVNCDVENRTIREKTLKYDKSGAVVQPLKSSEDSEDTQSSAPAARDPGASANTGAAGSNGPIAIDGGGTGAAAPANTTSHSRTETQNGVWVGQDETEIATPAGKDKVVSVAVRVPVSYFTAIFKLDPDHKNAAQAPTDFVTTQLANVRDGVKKVVGVTADDALSVDTYADLPVPDLAMATNASAQNSAMTTVGGHAKEIGIAVLAVVSLLMMATMVRKSTPVIPALAGAGGGSLSGGPTLASAAALGQIGSGESVAGEVGGGSGALDGMEMTDDDVRTQQMLDQVSTMVKQNPDSAANLVKKWLSRT